MRYALAAAGVALAVAGCGSQATGEPAPIDVPAGTFHGVGIGDTPERMHAVLGARSPASGNERVDPTGAADLYDGPTSFHGGSVFYRYESATFFSSRDGRIAYVMVTAPGSQTEGGVAIGDDLESARAAYPALRCGTANEGTDYRPYPACVARLAQHRWVWFGGDPITNITLGTDELEWVASGL